MSARAFDIMRELPAIFGAVTGLNATDVEIGYRDPAKIENSLLPRVLVYNPTTEEPTPPSFGLRQVEFGFAVLVVNDRDTDEATLELCEQMAAALSAASMTNADRAYMSPGAVVTAEKDQVAKVGAILIAEWEGL